MRYHALKPTYKFWFPAAALSVVALLLCVFLGAGTKWCWIWSVSALLMLLLAYRSVRRPLAAMQNGLYLLREQDYSSRLRRVGQIDADRVVDLFNSLMERMKHERLRLVEQNRFLDMLIEASPTGIAICNFDGSLRKVNKAFGEMANSAVLDTLASLASGESVVCRQGEAQILRCSRHFFMENGFKRSFYIVERLTDEIIRAEKDVFNKMVRTISHEVNNSLGGVVSLLETLAMLHEGDESVECAIEASRRSCMNLNAFTAAYASLAKIPAPNIDEVELNGFVRSVIPSFAKLCPDNIDLSLVVSDSPCQVRADVMLLERVLVNVIKNSVESIGAASGKITLRTGHCSLEVEDNGPGLSNEAAAAVFTPFFSTKRSDRGLGLMLVADILRSHNCDFSLRTDSTDGKTRFTINWPEGRDVVSPARFSPNGTSGQTV